MMSFHNRRAVPTSVAGWRRALTALALAVVAPVAVAQSALFDSHVHLWDGEKSLAAYEAQLKESRLGPARFAAMWFGGPNQALAGTRRKSAPATMAFSPWRPAIPG